MSTLSVKIDTYEIARVLISKGFTAEQAEAIIEVAKKADLDSIVTRDYLDIKINDLEQRLVIKFGSMVLALGAVLVAIKYFG